MSENKLEINGVQWTGWQAVVMAFLVGWAIPIAIGISIGWMLQR